MLNETVDNQLQAARLKAAFTVGVSAGLVTIPVRLWAASDRDMSRAIEVGIREAVKELQDAID